MFIFSVHHSFCHGIDAAHWSHLTVASSSAPCESHVELRGLGQGDSLAIVGCGKRHIHNTASALLRAFAHCAIGPLWCVQTKFTYRKLTSTCLFARKSTFIVAFSGSVVLRFTFKTGAMQRLTSCSAQ